MRWGNEHITQAEAFVRLAAGRPGCTMLLAVVHEELTTLDRGEFWMPCDIILTPRARYKPDERIDGWRADQILTSSWSTDDMTRLDA